MRDKFPRKAGLVYLTFPSFLYSSWILLSDISSRLVFFFLLTEQVSLKLREHDEIRQEHEEEGEKATKKKNPRSGLD